jgi:glycine/serine hydroxymethyltransferase
MDLVGDFMAEVLRAPDDESVQRNVHAQVKELCERFPLYDALM